MGSSFCHALKPSSIGRFFNTKEDIMNKRTSVLNVAKDSNGKVDKKSAEYKRVQIVKEVILRYYEIYDMDNGTIHSKVFSMLYF